MSLGAVGRPWASLDVSGFPTGCVRKALEVPGCLWVCLKRPRVSGCLGNLVFSGESGHPWELLDVSGCFRAPLH
eukprot:8352738-Alexandrium_andersonii.AAC.1